VWDIDVVDDVGNVGWTTSLALDSEDRPHIAYFDNTNDNLMYATFNGMWHVVCVDDTGDVGIGMSLAIDEDDWPVISYIDSTNGYLKVARIPHP
jgi:hypothetical protein